MKTPVIFLTADEDVDTETRGFEVGVSDFIRKPFNPDILIRRVENIVNTHGQMLKFEEQATIDKLTGFLNKYNANEQIGKLCASKEGALFIIDLDSKQQRCLNEYYTIKTVVIIEVKSESRDILTEVRAPNGRILYHNVNYTNVFSFTTQHNGFVNFCMENMG